MQQPNAAGKHDGTDSYARHVGRAAGAYI